MQDHSKDLAFTLSEMGSLHEQSWAMTWLETFSPVKRDCKVARAEAGGGSESPLQYCR